MYNQERNLKRKRNKENKDVQDDIAQENDDLPKEWKTSRNHPLDNIRKYVKPKKTNRIHQSRKGNTIHLPKTLKTA